MVKPRDRKTKNTFGGRVSLYRKKNKNKSFECKITERPLETITISNLSFEPSFHELFLTTKSSVQQRKTGRVDNL